MITWLGNLRSGKRKVYVDLRTDKAPDTAKLAITIDGCGSTVMKDVSIGPDATTTYEYQHGCQGERIVTVQEANSGLKTEKSLNLDN